MRLTPFPGGNKVLRADGQWVDPPGPVQSVAGKTGAVTLAKADVGLSNVDNTADASKPISAAVQTALDGKAAPAAITAAIAAHEVGFPHGGAADWDTITNKPATFPPDTHNHDAAYAAAGHVHDAAYSALGHAHAGVYEPANANIQTHVASAHAPANAQKNSDITKAEIEAKLTGEISSHTHAGSGSGPWTVLKKTGDTGRTNNTLLNDPDLAFTMNASTKYVVRGKVFFDTNATADFKWRHVGPALPTLVRINRDWIVPGTTVYAGIAVDVAFSAADLAVLTTGTNGGVISFEGVIHVGAAGGTFAFAWAQNTTNVGAATVRAGSYLEYMTA